MERDDRYDSAANAERQDESLEDGGDRERACERGGAPAPEPPGPDKARNREAVI